MWHDLTGQTFNNLFVIGRSKEPLPYARGRTWDCKCLLCGTIKKFTTSALLQGRNKACGCQRLKYDVLGKRFGRLVVLKEVTSDRREGREFLCRCDCGNLCVRSTASLVMKRKNEMSCGCSLRKYNSPEEENLGARYKAMVSRCYNQNDAAYPNYGGRGIYICDEWLEDEFAFINWALTHGYSRDLSIDRIDNDGPYAPWNCRWTNKLVQDNNKRINHFITIDDTSMSIADWAREAQLPYTQLSSFVAKYEDQKVGEIIRLFIRINRTRLLIGDSEVKFVREWCKVLGISDNKIAILLESGDESNLIQYIKQHLSGGV